MKSSPFLLPGGAKVTTLENVVPSPVVSIIEKFKDRAETILPETSVDGLMLLAGEFYYRNRPG